MHPSTTRAQILHALKVRGALQVREISVAVGTGESAVRPHLGCLAAERLVRVESVRQGPGRPRLRYHLTAEGHAQFPRRYGEFARSLVEGVLELAGPELLRRLFARQENELYAQHAPRMAGLRLAERIEVLRQILDDGGYMPRIEANGDRYTLVACNCPISEVAATCRSGCQSELRLIRRLTEADVTQVEVAPHGGRGCRYVIGPSATSLPQAAPHTT